MYAGVASSFGFGITGRSYSNMLASTYSERQLELAAVGHKSLGCPTTSKAYLQNHVRNAQASTTNPTFVQVKGCSIAFNESLRTRIPHP